MRKCLINDCEGFDHVAPCCLDCEDYPVCPDRCPKKETDCCVGVIENDSERVFETAKEP